MSVIVEKDYGIWISQKTWKRKFSEEPVSLQPYWLHILEWDLGNLIGRKLLEDSKVGYH